MSIPTMAQLREVYAAENDDSKQGSTAFNIEVAFYHGFMNACRVMKTYLEEGTADVTTVDDMMDQANADMAAEIGV